MQQVVSSEELLAAALQVYEQGKHPLTAMFGRDETLNGAGYAIYCCFEVPEKRDVHIVKGVFYSFTMFYYIEESKVRGVLIRGGNNE